MKSIVLHFADDSVFNEIRDSVYVRNMMGRLNGPADEFAVLLMKALDKGDPSITVARANLGESGPGRRRRAG